MTVQIQLGDRLINKYSRPYIIAEIGVNHEGCMQRAKELIRLAREGGADAAKFQTYKASKLASVNSPSYWDLKEEKTTSQHALFKKYDSFDENDYIELAKYCEKIGIEFLSTPFDKDSIEFLDPLMRFYKIASADITNKPFLIQVASKKKTVILSTGASTIDEISTAIDILKNNGCDNVILLHCVLNYPTPDNLGNLRMIQSLSASFNDTLIGYSDHTLPDEHMTSLSVAQSMGAVVIEKHFTFDKSLPGNDHYHSMDVNDLKNFVSISKKINLLHGIEDTKGPLVSEEISRKNARRSIVTLTNMKKNTIIEECNITYKRPGFGISPMHWNDIIGKSVNKDLPEDHILTWDDIK